MRSESKGPGRPRKDQPQATPPIDLDKVVHAWLGLWAVFQIIVWLVLPGKVLTGITMKEARQDAITLLPLVEKYPGIFGLLAFIGAPVALVKRIMKHLKDRKDKRAEARKGMVP